LKRGAIGRGKGERAVASYDEDSASMATEAAREAVGEGLELQTLIFATTSPPYAEKLNAATIHAALGLPASVRAIDLTGSTRMGLGALLLAGDSAASSGPALVCASDVVVGAPGGSREQASGDAAVAFRVGEGDDVGARFLGQASATTELLDVWRLPAEAFPHQWEERFGAVQLGPILLDTATRALRAAGVEPTELATVILDGNNARALAGLPRALGLKPEQVADPLAAEVGRSGAAHAGLLLARALDSAHAGDRILVICCADGCDALVLETTERITDARPRRSVDRWIGSKRDDLPYTAYLKWRGILPFEPPRRPDPERPAAPPMRRSGRWKFLFEGSRCRQCGAGHLPPQRVCVACQAVDEMEPAPYADVPCKVTTYTVDHLAYSLQPPVVAAVVDFEGGGRFECELTDVDPGDVQIGMELEMTFRRLFTAQGVHNYFFKARPKR
jgi:3-hydroxy-3-methylglutaryl CoA synthase/uncharacterized OB-fold protein